MLTFVVYILHLDTKHHYDMVNRQHTYIFGKFEIYLYEL